MKSVKKGHLSPKEVRNLQSEIAILRKIRHPQVIALRAVCETKKKMFLVTEHVAGGGLFEHIAKCGVISENDACKIIHQLLKALDYLHSLNIVHRDIKPENILIKSVEEMSIKLADFGFAKMFEHAMRMNTACGTPGYAAPEVLVEDDYGTPVDMWSVGVITYTLLSGQPPFPHQNLGELFTRITEAKYDFDDEIWSCVSSDAKNFIRSLLLADPAARLTAIDALNHSWIQQISSDRAAKLKIEMSMLETIKRDQQQQKEIEKTVLVGGRKNTGLAHKFDSRTYWAPYTCAFCNKFIWGFASGYQCSVCLADVHAECKKSLGKTCKKPH